MISNMILDVDIKPGTTVNDYLRSFDGKIGQIEFVDDSGGRIYTETEIPFIDEGILNSPLDCVRVRKCEYGYFIHMKLREGEVSNKDVWKS